ncbi:Glutathione S-transferase [Roseovarius sp. THAF27]|uniref:glutathione S-transferase family protein n=1 Tax=Roseovarius sp. THAF27 TaxID=2587850 RepID=UPI001267F6D3|nr:glutathione S-transferase family protein [Roseovarius sp. THAF27]QFT79564.1 Glutathione S-transferase [Roseovarius sp. THAF27]
MADKPVLYGFNGSTYVRTARMVLMDNEVDYDQVHVNVLEGEPKQPEHLKRHPFGKVPVMDIDDMRLRECDAICRYIDETGKGPSLQPDDPKTRAKMNEAISVFTSYGYDALMGAAGYHLFPELIGGRNDDALSKSLADSQTLNALLMDWADPFICGKEPTLADYMLAPMIYYVSLTPEADNIITGKLARWWAAVQEIESFKATEPDMG